MFFDEVVDCEYQNAAEQHDGYDVGAPRLILLTSKDVVQTLFLKLKVASHQTFVLLLSSFEALNTVYLFLSECSFTMSRSRTIVNLCSS